MEVIPEETGGAGFSLRALFIAIGLTLFLLSTSIYISLRLSALPWPIIFSVIISAGVLKILSYFKATNPNEINVAQAGGTIGGLMASGVAFTIPGIIFLRDYMGVEIEMVDPYLLALVCVSGGVLGVLLSIPLRRTFIDEENLPYPSGAAGAELLKAQFKGGRSAIFVTFIIVVAGLFAITRDIYFPVLFTLSSLVTYGIYITVVAMPMAIGIGFILGPKISLNSWFGGSVVGWLLIIPYLVSRGWDGGDSIALVQNAGMGIVLGSGVGFFVSYVVPKIRRIFAPLFKFDGPWYFKASPIFSIFAIASMLAVGVPVLAALVSVAGVWVMATIAARMTGETDINPLEQFGIIIGLVSLGLYSVLGLELGYGSAFLIVCFVSVAAAISGDIGHDYKSAKLIGTRPSDIIKVDFICVIIAGIAAPFILDIVLTGYADVLFDPVLMPAVQSQLVAGSIFGFAHPNAFYAGFGMAFVYELISKFSKRQMPFSAMAFGIGMFLGMTFGILLAIGGLISYAVKRRAPDMEHTGILVSAGLMGGEGIAGFLAAALFVAGIGKQSANYSVMLVFGISLILLMVYTIWSRRD
ncbi:MAG: OPT/YSL family transporter [Candidatus Methanofastidiosa archaeon]|nr:OPT/YSL family transporter [Candidatus Methanofastidiosa archaeon]